MIKLIGLKRAALLGILLSLNLLLAGTWLFGIDPLREDAANMLTSVNGQISRVSGDIQNIKSVLSTYQDSYARYQELGNRGFFSKQDRFDAGRLLDDLRPRAGLLGYGYRLNSIKTVASADAEAAQASLIDTRITLDRVSSVLDANVYMLLNDFVSVFPHHARLAHFQVKRSKEVNEAGLKELAQAPVPFVEAEVELDWLTVVPKQADAAAGAAAPANGFRGR